MSALKSALVIGAAAAQGIPVVKALVQRGKYAVQALTRNLSNLGAKLITSLPNVSLFAGDFFNEKDLREAFWVTQLAYVNMNRYACGEKGELYWGKYGPPEPHLGLYARWLLDHREANSFNLEVATE